MQVTSSFRAPCASAPTEQETLVNIPARVSNYPDLSNFTVVLQEPKRMGVCTITPVGYKRNDGTPRIFVFQLTSPNVIINSRETQYTKIPFERVDVMPNIREDPGNVCFEDFLNCVDTIVEKVKQTAMEMNVSADFSKWVSPVKYNHGRIVGVTAKVRSPAMRTFFASNRFSSQVVLELKFIYASEKRCGVTFEVVDAMPSETIPDYTS